MKATELRILNYVHRIFDSPENPKCKEIIIISAINSMYKHIIDKDDNIYDIEFIEPIPLTKEILLKCKFTKIQFLNINSVLEDGYFLGFFTLRIGYEDRLFHDCTSAKFNTTHIEVKYLHQLQNMFFALMGEELQVNL